MKRSLNWHFRRLTKGDLKKKTCFASGDLGLALMKRPERKARKERNFLAIICSNELVAGTKKTVCERERETVCCGA